MLGRSGLLYVGESKMVALATWADIVAHGGSYLMPLPLTGETAQQVEAWIDAVVDREQTVTLIWDEKGLVGGGYELERPMSAEVDGKPVTWTERVQVVRSSALAERESQQLEQRLAKAEAALRALTPLTLALRLLTLIESQVRRGLARAGEVLSGLYEGQPQRTTERPTGVRLLKAFTRAEITLTRIEMGPQVMWHITPLSDLLERILAYLGLSSSLYQRLAENSS
jgi:transposase